MLTELVRIEGNDLANQLHSIGANRVFVKPVDAPIGNQIVLFEGQPRRVRSVCPVSYQCLGGSALRVRFKPLPTPKRLQGKELSTETILTFLYDHAGPSNWKSWWANTSTNDWGDWSIANQFSGVINQSNEVVLLRKMSRLISKGLVNGCDCGCRGDFYLTNKGIEHVQQMKEAHAGN